MGRIDHDLHTLERERMVEGALAELDVAPCRVFKAPGLSQSGRVGPHGIFGQGLLDLFLPGIGQLGALGAEELDAVVVIRVVAGADDHAQAGALGARQIGHARRGQGAQQHHVHAGRVEPGLQRALQHVARDPRVLADQHHGTGFLAPQHTAHGMRQAQREVGGDGRAAHQAANSIGTKICACHSAPLLFSCCRAWSARPSMPPPYRPRRARAPRARPAPPPAAPPPHWAPCAGPAQGH